MASDPNQIIEKHPVDARQGTSRPKTVYVLAASVVLILIVFGAVALLQH